MAFATVGQTTVKRIKSLHKSKKRQRERLYFIEGYRLVAEALVSDVRVKELICTEDMLDAEVVERASSKRVPVRVCSVEQFQEMSDTVSPQGILGVVHMPEINEEAITSNVLVLDGTSDPGNAGTMVRTAEWFGFTTVLFTTDAIDMNNPKFLRSTMGSCFRMDIRMVEREDIPSLLPNHTLIATALDGENVSMVESDKKLALIIGSEAHGVSLGLLDQAHVRATIPGAETTESLNAAVAAGICMYALTIGKGLL